MLRATNKLEFSPNRRTTPRAAQMRKTSPWPSRGFNPKRVINCGAEETETTTRRWSMRLNPGLLLAAKPKTTWVFYEMKPSICRTTTSQKRWVAPLQKRIVRTGSRLRQLQGRSWRICDSRTEYTSSESASVWSEAIHAHPEAFTCLQEISLTCRIFPNLHPEPTRAVSGLRSDSHMYSTAFKVQHRPSIQCLSKSFAGQMALQVPRGKYLQDTKTPFMSLEATVKHHLLAVLMFQTQHPLSLSTYLAMPGESYPNLSRRHGRLLNTPRQTEEMKSPQWGFAICSLSHDRGKPQAKYIPI